ncbi:Zinc finger MIZ domain-containing protein 2 [Fulvia fulva]|nr:Zinc finger MIZ domain-containing protein 2 [Fulvia fulva]WPV14376.1 Zinc finger MIZ domain-containing protein 2 [Fulvia fulva]
MPRPAAQPGLPSPAPSDENNTDSPTLADHQLQQRRSRPSLGHARQHTDSWIAPTTRASVSASPVVMSPTQQLFAQQHHFQQSGEAQPILPIVRGHAHTNSRHVQRGSINQGQLPPDISPVMQTTRQPLHTPAQPHQLQASRIQANVLLQRLSSVENNPNYTLSHTETGRLILLREAVHKEDWFYQMTSQLFCARSGNRRNLPQSVLNLDSRCWDYLSILLCHNTEISPGLLQFFENFPEPIMHIYSDQSGAREIYEMRLQSIKAFLHKMPAQWDSLVARCKELQVPPLVQDLAENLNVHSPVLQTTISRAITRMLYGPQEIPLMSAVEKIHELDQIAWQKHRYRRSSREKSDAYTKLAAIWTRWREGRKQGRDAADFRIPSEVLDFFSRTPTNPGPSPAAPSRLLQQPQSADQHQQASYHQQLLNRFTQAQGHARPDRQSQATAQAISPLMPQQPRQYQAGLMNLTARRPPVSARAMHAPGVMYGRSKLLYPGSQEGHRPQPTQPDPIRSALHQAHLRSPVLTNTKVGAIASRMYRHVVGFTLPPTTLDRTSPWHTIPFDVTPPIAERLAKASPSSINVVDEQSLMLRLRCSELPKAGFESESAWVTADNHWPEEISFECNGVKLEARRKLHHGRYLPINLTDLVKTGENTLRISCSSKKTEKRAYAVAVEVISFMSHDSIARQLSHVTAEQSLTTIKRSLSGQDDGDDDLAVISSTMTIKLTDPYSGCRVFDTPVRGATCLHKDCFDLETFLSMCKRPTPGSPAVVDCWRCPLCRGDVRPQMLLVDGFMQQVREELANNDLLDTRAIIVEADGSWKPKIEEATGVRSPSLDREGSNSMPPPAAIPKAAPKPPPIVIELD